MANPHLAGRIGKWRQVQEGAPFWGEFIAFLVFPDSKTGRQDARSIGPNQNKAFLDHVRAYKKFTAIKASHFRELQMPSKFTMSLESVDAATEPLVLHAAKTSQKSTAGNAQTNFPDYIICVLSGVRHRSTRCNLLPRHRPGD